MFILDQRDIATVDDEDHAHFCKLGKEGNCWSLLWLLDHEHV